MGQWSHLYNRRWRKAREYFLSQNPMCSACAAINVVRIAQVVDHIKAHKGDFNLFWDKENWRALCKRCHDRKTATLDNDHGFGRWQRIPNFVEPPAIPVHIVCGPPSSGKTTYMQENAHPDAWMIDVDQIASMLSGEPIHQVDMEKWLAPTMLERNAQLAALAKEQMHSEAWFIVTAPTRNERNQWRKLLCTDSVTVMATSAEKCIDRIKVSDRPKQLDRIKAVKTWWKRYTSDWRTEQIIQSE